jgi:hypothetical protein
VTRAEISVAESHFLTLPTNPHFARQGVHATNGKSHDAHSTANDNNPPTPQDICTPPPYTGGSNKQSKLSMTSTREGDLKGTTIKGGLGWPVQQRAAFIPPPKHRFPTIPPSDGEKEKQAQVVRPEGPQDTNSLPIPQEGQTNKPSFTKTQLQGEIVGNDDRGGLGWPVPTARCFHPSTRPIPDNFPFQQSKRKTSTSYIQTEEREPTRPCPQYKRHPTTQQHSNDDDGQRQLSNTGTEKPLPKNHRQTNQGPQKKDIKARTLKERGCEFSYLPKTTRHSKGKRI